jgi:hypothetical protein
MIRAGTGRARQRRAWRLHPVGDASTDPSGFPDRPVRDELGRPDRRYLRFALPLSGWRENRSAPG